jgi:hypothetical protein
MTLARDAKFNITDFSTSKARRRQELTLLVSRTRTDLRDCCLGTFQRSDKRLDVICHLE